MTDSSDTVEEAIVKSSGKEEAKAVIPHLREQWGNPAPDEAQEAFLEHYSQISGSEEKLGRTLQHDINNLVHTPGALVAELLPDQYDIAEQLRDILLSQDFTLEERERFLQKFNEQAKNGLAAIDTFPPASKEYFSQYRRTLEAQLAMLPIAAKSIFFLEKPTRRRFETLAATTIPLGDVLDSIEGLHASIDEKTRQHLLNGPEAIIAFNLFKNAKRYNVDGARITVSALPNGFSVANKSRHALPDKIGTFGATSDPLQFTTGAGRFMVKGYAFLNHDRITDTCTPLADGKFQINISLEKSEEDKSRQSQAA